MESRQRDRAEPDRPRGVLEDRSDHQEPDGHRKHHTSGEPEKTRHQQRRHDDQNSCDRGRIRTTTYPPEARV